MVKIITFHFLPLVEQQLPILLCNIAVTIAANPVDQSQIRQLQVRAEILSLFQAISCFLQLSISNFGGGNVKIRASRLARVSGMESRQPLDFLTLGHARWRDYFRNSRANGRALVLKIGWLARLRARNPRQLRSPNFYISSPKF